MQVGKRIATNHGFRQGAGLRQMEPVVVGLRKSKVSCGIHIQGGCNIDDAQRLNACGVVYGESVGYAPAPVVTAQVELCHAQCVHQCHHVLRQSPFAVIAVVRQAHGFGRVAVTPQVGHHYIHLVLQKLGHAMPKYMALRKTMQQQEHRAPARRAAWYAGVDTGAVDFPV